MGEAMIDDDYILTMFDDAIRLDCIDCFWRTDFDRYDRVEDILNAATAHNEECEE